MADALDRIPKPSLPAAAARSIRWPAAPHLRESESDNESDSDPRDENAASDAGRFPRASPAGEELSPIPATNRSAHPRSVALFGGTFDPIHAGHIAVAQAAQKRFHLDAFISCRRRARLTKPSPRSRRFFIATPWSRLLAPTTPTSIRPQPKRQTAPRRTFSTRIDTVRRYRREHPDDHLYFIVGADQFLEIPTWKNYEALLDSCDFIIASRPGFRIDALRLVVPPEKLGRNQSSDPNTIVLRKSTVHILTTVASHISSTEIRQRLASRKNIHGLVPPRVEEYILGQALYR